ncbi:MAG: hydrogenase formation protein HypD [Candidatus Bathyarchaeia archaeon]
MGVPMESLSRLREKSLARGIIDKIRDLVADKTIRICHVCGTHEWTITHSGLRSLLPENLYLTAGPGCPVCIVPAREIDEAVWLALNGVTVITFGDMYRVPGTRLSLEDARSLGGNVRVVYSLKDAYEMAKKEEGREFVFFAIGFETTAPITALEVLRSPKNLSFLVSHRLIPPAMEFLMGLKDLSIDGFIAPGHVSTIIGMKPYMKFPEVYGMPIVIAGFEPLDVLLAVYMILKQLKEGKPRLENEYSRAVTYEGNLRAQRLMSKVFKISEGAWRGIGSIPSSRLELKDAFSDQDARKRYEIKVGEGRDIHPGCSCHLVILGKITPTDCPLFMKACTPERPKGACMVSSEGSCRIWASQMEP